MQNCKKKILIVNNNLHMGGIQKSLINLMKAVSGDYDITLLLFSKSGPLLNEIPEGVKVVTPSGAYRVLGLEKKDLKKHPFLFALKAFLLAYAKISSRRKAMRLLGLFQKKIRGYDVVVSYSHMPHHQYFGNGCAEFVLDKTRCDKKVCFVHCDYLHFGGQTEINNRAYGAFDKIACCSDSVRERFLQGSQLPGHKVQTVKNFYDLTLASYQSEDESLLDEAFINVLLIARLSEEKGIRRAIEGLRQSGRRDIRCYIIGDGPQKDEIAGLIKKYKMDERIIMLGEQRDPYQYLQQADWLLVPSFHEAAPIVFDEAMLMGVKVVTTNTTSAEEMIDDQRGIVCENSTEGIVAALMEIGKSARSAGCVFDNETQRKQLDALFCI